MTTQLTVKELVIITPDEVVVVASRQATILMDIVEKTKCYQEIAGKKYLQVEAWETIGAFNRTHAETDTISPIIVDEKVVGYQARVQLWKDGVVVGGAVMPCYFTENCCKGKEGDAKHKAAISAAQTFATSKAYRMNFSYVAILAGYQPMPAEEITEDMKQLEPNKEEHYCELHGVAFFKRGKMSAYAHPIGDTKQWCHEHKKPPQSASASPSGGVSPPPSDTQATTPAARLSSDGGQPGETHAQAHQQPVASTAQGGTKPQSAVAASARAPQEKPPTEPVVFRTWGEVAAACANLGVNANQVFARAGVESGKRFISWLEMDKGGWTFNQAWAVAQEIKKGAQYGEI